jgi:hypothetical protein
MVDNASLIPFLFAALAAVYVLAGILIRVRRCGGWYVYTVDNTSKRGIYVQVTVDGVLVDRCYRANVLRGYADCYVANDGQLQLAPDGMSILSRRLRGKVDVTPITTT